MNTGNIPWFASNGRLSALQIWRIALGALRRQLAPGPHSAERTPEAGIDPAALDFLTPPNDPLALAALGTALRTQPPWLLQHGMRTYAWGTILGMTEGRAFDSTTLYAASMLHDLGLTDFATEPRDHCFAVRGARAALRVAIAAGASRQQAEFVAAAIATHLDLTVAPEHGNEARLLQAGAALDVLGSRARELSRPLRGAVVARHPRLGMKAALCQCLEGEATRAVDTRIGLYVRRFHFLDLVRKAPFDE